MPAPLVRAEGLSKGFGRGPARVAVFENLSCEFFQGDLVAIIGPSGSGKSTLLHLLGGIDIPEAGEIELDGTRLFSLEPKRRAAFRNQTIGFVFQFHHLLAEFTAVENVSLPLRLAGVGRRLSEETAREILGRVGLAGQADRRPSEMSGGELSRAAVARALVRGPKIVLADEPTGNLDRSNADAVLKLLTELARERGAAVVLVTHDPVIARRCDKIFSLREGVLEAVDVREV
jgi:lipoprotein-releasing system ATP-binding protein